MPSVRIQRIRELLKREIGEVLRRELPVHETGLFSVNDVEVSGDLQSARIFVSVLGSPDQQRRAPGILNDLRPRIQGLIGRDLALRYTPVLTFVVDDSIAKGNRILQLIDELEHENPSAATPPDDKSPPA